MTASRAYRDLSRFAIDADLPEDTRKHVLLALDGLARQLEPVPQYELDFYDDDTMPGYRYGAFDDVPTTPGSA